MIGKHTSFEAVGGSNNGTHGLSLAGSHQQIEERIDKIT